MSMPADMESSSSRKKMHEMGQYFISSKKLGRGRFGVVYLGYHRDTHEKVAVKVIKRNKEEKYAPAEVQELHRLNKMLSNPYIIRMFDTQKNEGHFVLVLEYCGGGDLGEYIAKHGKLAEEDAKRLFWQLCSGLSYLKTHRILHRDLKPANIFLTSSNISEASVKIGDWGFAKSLDASRDLMQSQLGSPMYMSPERLDNKDYGFEAEIWALGVILYEMVFGTRAFANAQGWTDLRRCQEKLTFPTVEPAPSPLCLDLLRRMIVVDPKGRIALEEALDHEWLASLPAQKQLSQHVDAATSPLRVRKAALVSKEDEWHLTPREVPASVEAAKVILGVSVAERSAAGAIVMMGLAWDLLADALVLDEGRALRRQCQQQAAQYQRFLTHDSKSRSAPELLLGHAAKIAREAAMEELFASSSDTKSRIVDSYRRARAILSVLLDPRVLADDDDKRVVEDLARRVNARLHLVEAEP